MKLTKTPDRETASQQAAERISWAIHSRLEKESRATFIASGGTTPEACYRALSQIDLAWDRVDVVPSDERQVLIDDDQRNSKMLRQHLQRACAKTCTIHEIETYESLPQPAALTLLGMGEDGHFASIFPDISELEPALDLSSLCSIYEVETRASLVRRTTLSLSALCNSHRVVLLAFGEKKLKLINQPHGLPVQQLFNQSKTPLEIIWSP